MSVIDPPQREAQEDLNRGILPTAIAPWLARLMIGLFLATIFSVPVFQVVVEQVRHQPLGELELFARWPTAENLHRFEKDLHRRSVAGQLVRPHLQLALCRYQGMGNSNVIVGRGGWLFYRPGVDFLTGSGLLDPTRLRLRHKELSDAGEKTPCPDPRPAILAFHQACRQAGAHLVIVPVPDKGMIQPAGLTVRLAGSGPAVPTNRDYPRFLDELRAAGVDIFDPTPAQVGRGDPPRFLRHDTHWTPDWMDTVACGLADHLRSRLGLPAPSPHSFMVREKQVSGVGDLVDMLELPRSQTLFPPQTVTIRQVLDRDTGALRQPRADADVLLLGDSFCNIYGAGEMGWGEGAGFPAQLARHLGRDVDVIARNGSGASGTRRELARRRAPLSGKRVVIWEFAVRELMVGNWDLVPLPESQPDAPRPPSPTPSETPLLIEATVQVVSRVPQPHTVPYKDCLTYLKVHVERVLEGTYADEQMIVVMWGMKNNVLLPAAGYGPGKHLRLHLVPLRQTSADLQNARSVDDLDDYEHRPYLVVEEQGS
jgi:alginate O-acetyltransferase complex protein AlgJ